jgi:hypothetical protein
MPHPSSQRLSARFRKNAMENVPRPRRSATDSPAKINQGDKKTFIFIDLMLSIARARTFPFRVER